MATKVKVYRTRGAFERDAERMAKQGWSVISASDKQQSAGCLRLLMIGPLALFVKPKSKVMVTYQR